MKNKRWIYYIIVVVVVIVAVSLGIGITNFGKKTTADKTNTKEIQETKTKDDGEETEASDDGIKEGLHHGRRICLDNGYCKYAC